MPGPGGSAPRDVCSGRGCLVRGDLLPGGVVPGPAGGWSAPGGGGQGVPSGDPPGTATGAGGTHPTGMHSCFSFFLVQKTLAQLQLKLCSHRT